MAFMNIEEIDVKEKRVFVRVDFNCPLKDKAVSDDTRIRKALPTIELLLKGGARLVLASHLGRPKGRYVKELSLEPVAAKLAELINRDVTLTDDCIGDGARKVIMDMRPGQIVLLENLRFHKEETDNEENFAKRLAAPCDIYVNDAFGTAHRAHASTVGVTQHMVTRAPGLLMRKEIEYLVPMLENPKKPFLAILGGAKVSDKIGVIENLLDHVDTMILGGGMAYTFLKVKGYEIGNSLFEKGRLEFAEKILKGASARGVKLLLPEDHIVAEKPDEDATAIGIDSPDVPAGRMALDIGPKSRAAFTAAVAEAKAIFWNGPMGVFEIPAFSEGTMALAKAVAESEADSVVGGGDSVAAINRAGVADAITHVSTGGGASLELMEGKKLPGLTALEL